MVGGETIFGLTTLGRYPVRFGEGASHIFDASGRAPPCDLRRLAEHEPLEVAGDDLLRTGEERLVGGLDAEEERFRHGIEHAESGGQLDAAVLLRVRDCEFVRPVLAELAEIALGLFGGDAGFGMLHLSRPQVRSIVAAAASSAAATACA